MAMEGVSEKIWKSCLILEKNSCFHNALNFVRLQHSIMKGDLCVSQHIIGRRIVCGCSK